jgi:hypothetical protein
VTSQHGQLTTRAREQEVDEQREMIGLHVAWPLQSREREVVGDEDVVQGPAEARRQVRIERGEEAAPYPRDAQCRSVLQLPRRPRPGHVIQVTSQNGGPTLISNLLGR